MIKANPGSKDYYIFDIDGKKFCKRTSDEQGNPVYETKNGRITLQSLQEQTFNPQVAMINRSKRGIRHTA